ncbi:dolichol phosphate-mannose biosynthesis regulatory [Polychytrium aggregatum]|uniref:dolichol phosphate-mannose biosynthesis regulatory n=1 Tax=Polychytrium aggregatum TaxID=110093 RepID=UPI0022FE231F|nr:dolichol phosphate-mannose biosynthesis regulatory [Polychytrium aggregatum]KAI9202808.1 dolichol phosphate-mannose biosynthesis regulatory [Polychytrium aggregatum]
MATFSDQLFGGLLLLIATFVFSYYTVWALILPFVPDNHLVQAYFPPAEWAIRGPVILLVVGVSAIGGFISYVLLKGGKKKKQN